VSYYDEDSPHPFWATVRERGFSDGRVERLRQCNVGMATNGVSIAEHFEHGTEDIDLGTFDDGWISQPGVGPDCPQCSGDMPCYVHGHRGRNILLLECAGCLTRYDGTKLGGQQRG
jgi:hypothetical protein